MQRPRLFEPHLYIMGNNRTQILPAFLKEPTMVGEGPSTPPLVLGQPAELNQLGRLHLER